MRPNLFLLALATLAVLTTSSDGLRAQAPAVFQAGVDLVQLDVIVLDRNRRPVTGLTAADFTITEDGRPREIQVFSPITLPGPMPATTSASWTRDVAPDVVENTVPNEGRLVVIQLDYAIPAGPMTVTARTIARAAVEALGPNDLAAVVRSNPIAGDGESQGFTSDKSLLKDAIESPFMGLTKAPPLGLSFGVDDVPGVGDPENPYCPCGVCQRYTMERVANQLAATHNRHKSLLFVGRDILVNEAPGPDPRNLCDVKVAEARDKTLRALDRANVTVHSIDPSGLETLAATASNMRRVPGSQNLARQAHLGVLPDYTGGRTVLNTNAPESFMPQLFAETSSYYLLGFARSERTTRDARRTIRVRVNRPNVTVRSRTGYYAPPPADATDEPVDPDMKVLGSLLPRKDLPLTLGLTPRFRPDGTSEVVLLVGLDNAARRGHMPADGADAIADASAKDKTFEVTIGVFDSRARPMGIDHQTVEVPASAVLRPGKLIESLSHLTLDPDRYEVRVAVTDITTDTTGSVYGYVEVGKTERTALSGILIGAPIEVGDVGPITVGDVEPITVGDVGPITVGAEGAVGAVGAEGMSPTLRRTFTAGDRAVASIQILARRPRVSVTLRSSIRDDQDRVVFESSTVLDAERFAATPVGNVSVTLPTSSLAPGRYLLTMETGEGEDRRVRQVRFDVEASKPD